MKTPTERYEGSPCIHGHGNTRYTATRRCVICSNEKNELNNEDYKASRQRYYGRIRDLKKLRNAVYNEILWHKEQLKIIELSGVIDARGVYEHNKRIDILLDHIDKYSV